MRKSNSQGEEQMTDAAFVDQAAGWAKHLTQREARGPGDMENAWHRLEARYGVPWRAFWALRYRKPRDITVSLYHRLHSAYVAECERQQRLLAHEIETTKTITGSHTAAIRAAETLVGSAESEDDALLNGGGR